jgi:hypothetical protein
MLAEIADWIGASCCKLSGVTTSEVFGAEIAGTVAQHMKGARGVFAGGLIPDAEFASKINSIFVVAAFAFVFMRYSSAQENLALDSYTCAAFLSDSASPGDGGKLLKSLMMISWATGYASAYEKNAARADASAIMLIAGALGGACRNSPARPVVDVAAEIVANFATTKQAEQRAAASVSTGPSNVAFEKIDRFWMYDNRDISGADLHRVERIDLQKCQASCSSEQLCQAFAYDKWNKWCFLKSEVRPLSLEPSSLVGVKTAIPEPEMSKEAPRIDRRVGKSLVGRPYQTEKRKSLDTCETNCLSDKKCLAFSFAKASSLCKTYDQVETYGLDPASTSGIKTQNPP